MNTKILNLKIYLTDFCSHDLHLKRDHYHLNRLLLNLLESVKSHRISSKEILTHFLIFICGLNLSGW